MRNIKRFGGAIGMAVVAIVIYILLAICTEAQRRNSEMSRNLRIG